jgi:hypothetical protein
MNDHVNLSGLLSATADELRANGQVAGVYLALMIPVSAASQMFEGGGGSNFASLGGGFELTEALLQQGAFAGAFVFAAFVVGVVANYWLLAGMTRRTLAPGFDRFLPYVGIYILSTIAIGFGLVLLIVPGIILLVRWIPLLPLVIDRHSGAMGAFDDSWAITRGHGWSIFGAVVILIFATMVAAGIVGGFGLIGGGAGAIVASALGAAAEQLSTVLFAAFAVGAWRLMRDNRDELAEVFA